MQRVSLSSFLFCRPYGRTVFLLFNSHLDFHAGTVLCIRIDRSFSRLLSLYFSFLIHGRYGRLTGFESYFCMLLILPLGCFQFR